MTPASVSARSAAGTAPGGHRRLDPASLTPGWCGGIGSRGGSTPRSPAVTPGPASRSSPPATARRRGRARLTLHRGAGPARARTSAATRLPATRLAGRHLGLVSGLVLIDEPEIEEGLLPQVAIRLPPIPARGNGPKIARPTRKRVAPSSTATSKSSVMPIESSARPGHCGSQSIAQPPQGAEVGSRRLGGSAHGRHRHQPPHLDPEPDRRRHQRRRLAGGDPGLAAAPPDTFTWTRTGGGRPGPFAQYPARSARSSECSR